MVITEMLPVLLLSIVTAPFRAKALPVSDAPVLSVMDVKAIMFPKNEVVVPRVAELPTCQNNPSSVPPFEPAFMIFTTEALAVVSVLPI